MLVRFRCHSRRWGDAWLGIMNLLCGLPRVRRKLPCREGRAAGYTVLFASYLSAVAISAAMVRITLGAGEGGLVQREGAECDGVWFLVFPAVCFKSRCARGACATGFGTSFTGQSSRPSG